MALASTHPQKWVPGIFPGGKGGRCVGLTTLPPSCADCLENWESQPSVTLRACLGLYRECFPFTPHPPCATRFAKCPLFSWFLRKYIPTHVEGTSGALREYNSSCYRCTFSRSTTQVLQWAKNALYSVDNASRDPVSHAKCSGLRNAGSGRADVEIRLAPGRPDGVSAYYLRINWNAYETHTDTSATAEPCLEALRTGFSLRPVVVRIEAGKLAIGQVFLRVLRLSPGSTFHQISGHIDS